MRVASDMPSGTTFFQHKMDWELYLQQVIAGVVGLGGARSCLPYYEDLKSAAQMF